MRATRPSRKRATARRLFAFDRGLGVRFVAGADEAGPRLPRRAARRRRGAVRLRAAAACARCARSRRSTTPSSTTPEAREALYPLVMRPRRASRSSRAACAASTTAACTSRTSRRCATRCARVARAGLHLPVRRLPRSADVGHEQRAVVGGDARSAAIAAASCRQGHARPLHARAPTRCTPAGSSPRTSATRRPSTARRSRPRRLAAAPAVVPVDRVPAAGALVALGRLSPSVGC